MGGAILYSQEPKKYMGGKVTAKYFLEDVWPTVWELFSKLNINEIRGLSLFKAFVEIDVDESETIEPEESLRYFGIRTKFTERFFYVEQTDPHNPSGLNFHDWAIEAYNFLSLDPAGVARFVFEIFDVDSKMVVEKADVETMYRMLYDCDDHDEYFVDQLPYDRALSISKAEFCKYCARHRHIIQPALYYQRKVRKALGGIRMWEGLAGYRRRVFQAVDTGCTTLSDAITTIVNMEDPSRRRRQKHAELLLKEQTAMLGYEQELAEKEAKQREKQLAREQKMATRSAELVKMKKCWHDFSKKKKAFLEAEYTTDDIWMRREHRLELFTLLDAWNDAAERHWVKTDKATLEATMGTEEDHIMRYADFLATPEGQNLRSAVMMRYLFENLKAKTEAEKSKSKKSSSMSGDKTTMKDVEIKTCIEDLTAFIENFDHPEAQDDGSPVKFGMKKRAVKHKGDKDALMRETVIMNKYAKPTELNQYAEQADEFLRQHRREALIRTTNDSLAREKAERKKEYIRLEFDIASNLGSRITSWEFVFNPATEKMVYVNVDTLEMIHRNSSICEKCDSLIEQYDVACLNCKFPRSAKNTRLYRPLGAKDIRVD